MFIAAAGNLYLMTLNITTLIMLRAIIFSKMASCLCDGKAQTLDFA